MIEQGATEAVLQHPLHDYTKRLLADVPRIGGWNMVPDDVSIKDLVKVLT